MKLVKSMPEVRNIEIARQHYKETGNGDVELDESDLIIFRLLGAKFEYNAVEFEN